MHPELPGCAAVGSTPEEALELLAEFREAWLAQAAEEGRLAPSPVTHEYNGKFTVRMPRTLHRELVARAMVNGVSLNQMALQLLSGGQNKSGLSLEEGFSHIVTQFQMGQPRIAYSVGRDWLSSLGTDTEDYAVGMTFSGK